MGTTKITTNRGDMMIKNRTIFTGDNLDILRGMDSESIDLIYLDPPFNSNRSYSAPIGSEAAGAHFKDAWTFEDTDAAWWGELADKNPGLWSVINAAGVVGGKGDKAYLIYMAMRILELHRVLKSTGSLYLHCDTTMSHSLKMLMDAIFGKNNFRNEIVWRRGTVKGGKTKANQMPRNHDTILFFSKTDNCYFNRQYLPFSEKYMSRFKNNDNDKRGPYRSDQPIGTRSDESIKKMKKDGVIFKGKNGKLKIKSYLNNLKGIVVDDNWTDINEVNVMSKERTGYPTQKPLALLERIIKASCPEDGVILDPFCGCATTCIASEDAARKWIGIDISEKAVELVKLRAEGRFSLFPVNHRTKSPTRNVPPRSKDIKHILYGQQEGRCAGCKCYFEFRNFEVDHIIPRKKADLDTDENLQLLCGHCNRVKGARSQEYLLADIAKRK